MGDWLETSREQKDISDGIKRMFPGIRDAADESQENAFILEERHTPTPQPEDPPPEDWVAGVLRREIRIAYWDFDQLEPTIQEVLDWIDDAVNKPEYVRQRKEETLDQLDIFKRRFLDWYLAREGVEGLFLSYKINEVKWWFVDGLRNLNIFPWARQKADFIERWRPTGLQTEEERVQAVLLAWRTSQDDHIYVLAEISAVHELGTDDIKDYVYVDDTALETHLQQVIDWSRARYRQLRDDVLNGTVQKPGG